MELGRTDTNVDTMERTMRRLLTFLACLIGMTGYAQYRPNYFDTNASPFSVVPGVSVYVPTIYTTNLITTNMSVTDYLFIGTAQVNYLTMLGAINQQGVAYTNFFNANSNVFYGRIFANIEDATNSTGAGALFGDTSTLNDITFTPSQYDFYVYGCINVQANGMYWYHFDPITSISAIQNEFQYSLTYNSGSSQWELYDSLGNLLSINPSVNGSSPIGTWQDASPPTYQDFVPTNVVYNIGNQVGLTAYGLFDHSKLWVDEAVHFRGENLGRLLFGGITNEAGLPDGMTNFNCFYNEQSDGSYQSEVESSGPLRLSITFNTDHWEFNNGASVYATNNSTSVTGGIWTNDASTDLNPETTFTVTDVSVPALRVDGNILATAFNSGITKTNTFYSVAADGTCCLTNKVYISGGSVTNWTQTP